jgi:hypothetical protein
LDEYFLEALAIVSTYLKEAMAAVDDVSDRAGYHIEIGRVPMFIEGEKVGEFSPEDQNWLYFNEAVN